VSCCSTANSSNSGGDCGYAHPVGQDIQKPEGCRRGMRLHADTEEPMNDRIRQLLAQMTALEDELREALHEQETGMLFEIRGKRVEFEHSIKQVHRRLKTRSFTGWSPTGHRICSPDRSSTA
jgi:hypothetical protein